MQQQRDDYLTAPIPPVGSARCCLCLSDKIAHLFLMAVLLVGQVFPLRHCLGDVDDRLDGLVERRLDAVDARLNHDLRDDKDDVGEEQRRRSFRATGLGGADVTRRTGRRELAGGRVLHSTLDGIQRQTSTCSNVVAD